MATLRMLGLSVLASFVVTGAALLTAPRQGLALTMAQARKVAQDRAPGTVLHETFSRRGGGRRYLFEIGQGRRLREIGVDPASGLVVADVLIGPAAMETQGDAR